MEFKHDSYAFHVHITQYPVKRKNFYKCKHSVPIPQKLKLFQSFGTEKCGQAKNKKRDNITSTLLSTKLCCDFYFTHCSWFHKLLYFFTIYFYSHLHLTQYCTVPYLVSVSISYTTKANQVQTSSTCN